jgi:hypothetical protein
MLPFAPRSAQIGAERKITCDCEFHDRLHLTSGESSFCCARSPIKYLCAYIQRVNNNVPFVRLHFLRVHVCVAAVRAKRGFMRAAQRPSSK